MRTIQLGSVVSLALCCTVQNGICQATFQRQFGGADVESVGQIALASDGGFLIAGSTRSYGSGETDAYVIRLNAQGDTLWTRAFGGAAYEDLRTVLADDDGWLVAGYTSSFGAGQSEALLVNLDDAGNLLWSKTYGNSGPEGARWIERTADGGLIMTGYSGSGGTGMYLVRLTADGDTLWTKKTKLIGGSFASMDGECVVENSNGDFLVLGDANDLSVCLYHFDQAGAAIATGAYQGLQNYNSRIHVIKVSTGGYLVVGTTAFPGLALEAFAMRLNADLFPVWTKRYGGSESERVTCVLETADGGFAILGSTYSFGSATINASDVYLLKIDSLGELEWSRTLGGSLHEGGEYMVQTPDGGFCIAGTVLGSTGNSDILVIMVDADGHGGCTESTPPTVAVPVLSTRVSESRQVVVGSELGVPQLLIGNGGLIADPCNGPIAVPELQASSALAWHQAEVDILLTGSSSTGIITAYDATGRLVGQQRAQEGTTRITTYGNSAGVYMATYADGDRWSSYRFARP